MPGRAGAGSLSVVTPPVDVVPWAPAAQRHRADLALRRSTAPRPHLMAFAGSFGEPKSAYSGGFRQGIAGLYGGRSRHPGCATNATADGDGPARGVFVGAHTGARAANGEALADSDFALCPEGWSSWTPRPVEALAAGAVPVLASDSVVLPGSGWLRWEAFSLRVPASREAALEIEAQLRAVPRDVVRTMQT